MIMVYIGDLSYLVYLAHWPVIVLYKYYCDVSELTVPDMSLCLLTTLIISVILHHSLESFFISSSTTVSVAFVAAIYVFIIAAIAMGGMQRLSELAHPVGEDAVTESLTTSVKAGAATFPSNIVVSESVTTTANTVEVNKQESIRWNQVQTKVVYFKNPDGCVRDYEAESNVLRDSRIRNIFRWTGEKGEVALRCVSSGNGTAKVLVLGNSYGYRAFPLLHRIFDERYSQMRLFTKSSRVYLTKDPKSTRFAIEEKTVVEKFQPDITFLIEKDSFKILTSPIVGDVETDPVTKYMQAAIDVLSNNSGTVVVDNQYIKPAFKDGVAYIIQKRLQQGKSNFEDLGMKRKDFELIFANETKRMSTIKNDNVIINKVRDQLCPGEECLFFEQSNLHSYYGDAFAHLTSEGLKVLEHNYSEIIEDFLLRLQSTKNEGSDTS